MKDFYVAPEAITPDMEANLVYVAPKKTPFWRILLRYCAIWLAVIGVSCGLFLAIIDQYEKSLPRYAMDEYIHSSRQDMFFYAISSLRIRKQTL